MIAYTLSSNGSLQTQIDKDGHMSSPNIFSKLRRVRNLPRLGFQLVRAVMPGGFLTSTAHLRKQKLIKEAQRAYDLRTFVETGTNEGEMVEAVKSLFTRIYSVELDMSLFKRAGERFRDQKHIEIVQGDSAEVLPRLLREISTPCLFWLDAHYSGGVTAKGATETPILQEIDDILRHGIKDHLILIDDAWCFGTMKDYPSIPELKKFVKQRNASAQVKVSRGVIWVTQLDKPLSE